MGFFSWRTLDTDRSISNAYSEQETFTVYMHDDKGNKWVETNYQGYGVFGGKDYYELLAEMNGITCEYEGDYYTDWMRSQGINLAFRDNSSGDFTEGVKYPNLVESFHWGYQYQQRGNKSCESQGYFYN